MAGYIGAGGWRRFHVAVVADTIGTGPSTGQGNNHLLPKNDQDFPQRSVGADVP